MTPTVNNKTGAFEKLLRSHIKASDDSTNCPGFDADLAAAYLERTIPAATHQRYERHLGECASCRFTVAHLARSDQPDLSASKVDKAPVKSARADWLFGLLSALATPKWALAGLALLVAVISVPVVIKLNAHKDTAVAFREESAASESKAAISTEFAKNTGPATNQNGKVNQPSPASIPAERQLVAGRVEGTGPGAGAAAAQPASGDVAAAESDKKPADREAPSGPAVKDDLRKTEEPATRVAERRDTQPERKANEDRTELEKIDSARALSVPEDKNKGAEVRTLKQGNAGAKTEKERTATVKPLGEVTPRPTEVAGADRARSGISAPPPQPRDRDNKDAVKDEATVSRASGPAGPKPAKPEERRVSNKTFRLIGGVWTDKSYKPDKEIPVVPLVWDTDVYNEMLVKQAGLKPYFSGFKSDERVVLIYKGTIYKLVPPEK